MLVDGDLMPNLADSLTAKFTSAISHSINQSRSAPYFISVEAPAKWFAAGPRQSLNERERERSASVYSTVGESKVN